MRYNRFYICLVVFLLVATFSYSQTETKKLYKQFGTYGPKNILNEISNGAVPSKFTTMIDDRKIEINIQSPLNNSVNVGNPLFLNATTNTTSMCLYKLDQGDYKNFTVPQLFNTSFLIYFEPFLIDILLQGESKNYTTANGTEYNVTANSISAELVTFTINGELVEDLSFLDYVEVLSDETVFGAFIDEETLSTNFFLATEINRTPITEELPFNTIHQANLTGLSNGSHTIRINCTDFEFEEVADITFAFFSSIDLAPPNIVITNPPDGITLIENSTWFNLTTDENATCTYSLIECTSLGGFSIQSSGGGGSCGGTAMEPMNITGGTFHSQLVTGLQDTLIGQTYELQAECRDISNNSNVTSTTFFVNLPKPDLAVKDIIIEPENPKTGDFTQVSAVIENRGNLATSFSLDHTLIAPNGGGGGSLDFGEILPSQILTINFINFTPQKTGTHNFTVSVDSAIDSNFSNNQLQELVNVSQGNCLIPEDGMIIDKNTILCKGVYNLPNGIELSSGNIILECNNSVLNGSGSGFGIELNGKKNNIIKNCIIHNYGIGLELSFGSNNNQIYNSVFLNNSYGIEILNSHSNILADNYIVNNSNYGLILNRVDSVGSNNNIILRNNITNNFRGLDLSSSQFNNISLNIIKENQDFGISLRFESTNNSINHNMISNNPLLNLVNEGSNISAILNYWGEIIRSKIQDKISGMVDFVPFYLDSSFTLDSTMDSDEDGYANSSLGGTDCDDANNTINPAATEELNAIDDNCNGNIDEGFVFGNSSINNSNIPNLNLKINNSQSFEQHYEGIINVSIGNGSDNFVEFPFNFSQNSFNLSKIKVEIQNTNGTKGTIIINGIELPNGLTKTVYVDNIDSSVNTLCIDDAEISNISEISSSCNDANEILVTCDGSLQSGYTCGLFNNSTKYKVTGLKHSGITEQAAPPSPPSPSPSGGGGSSGGGGGGGGGGAFYVCNQEWKCGEWSDCVNGAQSRECNLVKVKQHTQNTTCPSINKAPETGKKCQAAKNLTLAPVAEEKSLQASVPEPQEAKTESSQDNLLTGAVTGTGPLDKLLNNPKAMREIKIWSTAFVLIVLGTGGFIYYNRKKKA